MLNKMYYEDFFQIQCIFSTNTEVEVPSEFMHQDDAEGNLKAIAERFKSNDKYEVDDDFDDDYLRVDRGVKVTNKTTGLFFIYVVRHNYVAYQSYKELERMCYAKKNVVHPSIGAYY